VIPHGLAAAMPAAAGERVDRLCIDAIRTLTMDAVERARSGHPGMPMAMAPVAYLVYSRYLRHNPRDPGWPDRDRFVLSAGHGSMLLYSVLHLCGYDLPLAELERFANGDRSRQGIPSGSWAATRRPGSRRRRARSGRGSPTASAWR